MEQDGQASRRAKGGDASWRVSAGIRGISRGRQAMAGERLPAEPPGWEDRGGERVPQSQRQ